MNLPNKLTLGRILLVPFFVAALLIPFPSHNMFALLLFIAASVTDLLDGRIARKYNLITDFGKFADPLADKILVLSALLVAVGFVLPFLTGQIPEVGSMLLPLHLPAFQINFHRFLLQ